MQVIALSNGSFQVRSDFAIGPATTAAELVSECSGKEIKETAHSNGHRNFVLRNMQIGELYFIITVYFQHDAVTSMSFICRSKPYPDIPSWDNFNAAEEEREALFLKHWMLEQTGALLREFEWGKVGVYYDHHNYSTFGKLDYVIQ